MRITFDRARAIVAASKSVRRMWGDNYTVVTYGWENDDFYLMLAIPASGLPVIDGPDLLVAKRTGALTEVYGMPGEVVGGASPQRGRAKVVERGGSATQTPTKPQQTSNYAGQASGQRIWTPGGGPRYRGGSPLGRA